MALLKRNSAAHDQTAPQSPAGSKLPVLVVTTDNHLPRNVVALKKMNDLQVTTLPEAAILENTQILSSHAAMVIVFTNCSDPTRQRQVVKLIEQASKHNLLCLVLHDDARLKDSALFDAGSILPRVHWCDAGVGTEELYGRLCAMNDYRPVFDRIEEHLGQVEHWTRSLNERFEELHQELRLAWRVQQDFLPKKFPQSNRLRFAALYRPASWVSGDIYDIFQLDERHIGLHIADVVGHGVAAGLMTLFVKRALVTKETQSNSYRLVHPHDVLSKLNLDLCQLELPEQQFVTACYGHINTDTLELVLVRGGHPFPIVIDPRGRLTELTIPGPLLGVFDGGEFPEHRMTLQPGSKLVMVTDGLKDAFGHDEKSEQIVMDHLSRLSSLSAQEMVDSFQGILDCHESSLHPTDDITMIVVEVTRA